MPPSKLSYILTAGTVLLGSVSPAIAQEPASDPRIQLGPVGLGPRFALTNIGVDNNVFRDESGPRRDFTAQISPGIDATLQVGSVLFSSGTTTTYNFFAQSRSQRSFDIAQTLRAELLLTRLKPFASGSYRVTRQRPNLEIDQRIRAVDRTLSAGTRVEVSPMFSVGIEGHETRLLFGERKPEDTQISAALDRVARGADLDASFQLTPLTALTVQAGWQRDEFRGSSLRDSERRAVTAGLVFQPSALISGSVHVGMRRFDLADPSIPDETGIIADANLAYVLSEMTRFAVDYSRDVDYSFRDASPYFVGTSATYSITQVIGLYWDVVARYGTTRLDYRRINLPGAPVVQAEIERGSSYGVGVGRHFASSLRVGIDVTQEERESDLDDRNYEGLRAGGTVTYGF